MSGEATHSYSTSAFPEIYIHYNTPTCDFSRITLGSMIITLVEGVGMSKQKVCKQSQTITNTGAYSRTHLIICEFSNIQFLVDCIAGPQMYM